MCGFLAKVIPIPQRAVVAFLCFWVVALSFALRLVLSMTIIEMINLPNNFTQDNSFDYCWNDTCDRDSEVKNHEKQYDWSEINIGYLIAAFSIGYFIVQLPVGVIVDICSGKLLWGIGMIVASVLTLIIPMTRKLESNFFILFMIRVAIGFFEGPVFNSMNAMLSKWFPDEELWLASGMVYSGVPFGGMVSTLFAGTILHFTHKWSNVYLIFGIVGLVFSIICFLFLYESPEKSPCISENEKEFLNNNIIRPGVRCKEIPFLKILLNPAVNGLIIVRAGQDFGFNILMNYFPKYFSEILCFDLPETTIYTTILFFSAFATTILSTLIAAYLEKCDITLTNIRKMFSGFSSILPAVFIVVASFYKCDKIGVMTAFCITMCGMGFYLSGICTNELALSRNFCGTISGICNMGSGVTAIGGPIVVGFLVKTNSLSEWRVLMWAIFIILNAGTIPYMMSGSGENQDFEADIPTLTRNELIKRKEQEKERKHRCTFC